MDKIKRIKELTKQLNQYRNSYYNNSVSEVSDQEYDNLFDELKKLEEENNIVMANSPTHTVGYEVKSKLEKVKHSHSMLSLDKTKSVDDLKKFAGDKDCLLMCKMDGCFTADTRISMADGSYKKIKDIEIGDDVLSFDENTLTVTSKKVVNTHKNGFKTNEHWMKIGVFTNRKNSKNKVSVTKNHLIMTDSGWKKASDIKIGDTVYIYDYKLTDTQKSVILGFSLGDGSSLKRSENNYGMEYRYSKTDKYPYNIIFHKICSLFDGEFGTVRHRKSGFGSDMLDCHIKKIRDIPKEYYNNKNLLRCGYTFTEEILSLINPLALAIYYIDDGSRCPSKDDGYTNAVNVKTRCILHTNRHNTEEVHRFSKFLSTFMGIENSVRKEKEINTLNGGSGLIIQLSDDGTEKFFDLIAPYIPKELRKIKLGLKDKWQNAKVIEWWNDNQGFGLIKAEVSYIQDGIFIENSEHKSTMSYDLEVEDNHTYFANNFAVHNCTTMLTYENGELIQAETRGNGEEGEIITHNAKVFENIPLHIDYKRHLEIEGEAIITYSDFERINSKLPENEKYKNPRNLVSGSVRQLDSNIAAQRHIKFIAWKVPYIEDQIKSDNAFLFRLNFAKNLGFDIVPFYLYTNCSSDKENIHNMVISLQNKAKELGYPIDGLVMAYNDIAYGQSLGTTGHHPKHSLAFKFYDDIYPTKLINVEFTMGKTGVLTPTAVFKPVEIDGTMVERASLHNLSVMRELGVEFIGQEINVYKANQIIPQVYSAETIMPFKDPDDKEEAESIVIPDKCPICGADTEIPRENDVEILICTNPDCKGKLLGKLSHFVSKNAINIDGLSEQTLQKFIDLKWLNSFRDIYSLSEYKEEMYKLDGFGKKSVDKLLESIERSRNTTLDRFIYGLCIPLIGRTASKTIAKEFDNKAEEFYDFWCHSYDFSKLDDFGDTMNNSMQNFIKNNYRWIAELIGEFNFRKSDSSGNVKQVLDGKAFVITGSLNFYKNREELVSVIERNGGKVSGSVSAKTSYLINNDVTSTSGKNKKAHDLGIPIINEGEFVQMITS